MNATRVTAARRNHSIPGHLKPQIDPEIVSLRKAAEYCQVPTTVVIRLVVKGVLSKGQPLPRRSRQAT